MILDLTCTPQQGAPLLLKCIDSTGVVGLSQPWATVITGALAVLAAVIAFFAASRQASAQIAAANETTLREKQRADDARTAIRRQVSAYAYNVIAMTSQLIVVNSFPSNHAEYFRIFQRLIDRLSSLDTIDALSTPEYAKALNELAYLESGLVRLQRRWNGSEKSERVLDRLRVSAARLFQSAENVAAALSADDVTSYAASIRAKHGPLIESLIKRANQSRTLVRTDDDAE